MLLLALLHQSRREAEVLRELASVVKLYVFLEASSSALAASLRCFLSAGFAASFSDRPSTHQLRRSLQLLACTPPPSPNMPPHTAPC